MFACGYSIARLAAFFEKLSLKSASSRQRRRSLRNWENGVAFFTCCG